MEELGVLHWINVIVPPGAKKLVFHQIHFKTSLRSLSLSIHLPSYMYQYKNHQMEI
jgi:hypothetical protein